MRQKTEAINKKSGVKREKSASHIRKSNSSSLTNSPADRIMFLQRTIGNQAVERLIKSGALQAKLRIGQPGDVYEQEADRVADAVMRMPDPGVQRQVEPEEEEEETLQTKPLVNQITPLVQVQRQEEPEEEEEEIVQPKLEVNPEYLIQRQKEEEKEEPLQTKQREGTTSEITNNIESQIQAIRSGGQALDIGVRTLMEPSFRADFSGVRVHSNAQSDMLNHKLNACAFTTGQDIFFRQGAYNPNSQNGLFLLAHELTHVVQQNGDKIQHKPTIEEPIQTNSKKSLTHQKDDKKDQPALSGLHSSQLSPGERPVLNVSPASIQRKIDLSIQFDTYSLKDLIDAVPIKGGSVGNVIRGMEEQAYDSFGRRKPVMDMNVKDRWYYYNSINPFVYATRSQVKAILLSFNWIKADDTFDFTFNYKHTGTETIIGSFAVASGSSEGKTDTLTGGVKLSYSVLEISGAASTATTTGITSGSTVTTTNYFEHNYDVSLDYKVSFYNKSDFSVKGDFWKGYYLYNKNGPHIENGTIKIGTVSVKDDDKDPDNLTP